MKARKLFYDHRTLDGRSLDRLATDVQGNAAAISDLRVTAEALLQTVTLHQQGIEASQRNFELIASRNQGIAAGEQANA